MIRASSLAILATLSLALATPAFAKTSIPVGKKLCREAAATQQPAPASIKVGTDDDRVTNDSFFFVVKLKSADGVASKMMCTVDRAANTAAIGPMPQE